MKSALRASPLLLALLFPLQAHAAAVPLEFVDRGTNRINLDGILGDWRRFTELVSLDDDDRVVRGTRSGSDDASFSYALARDNENLYVAAEIRDDRIVRSREHRTDDDAIALTFAVSSADNRAANNAVEVLIYPGEPGSFPGAVRFRGRGAVPGAQIVEAPLRSGGGYSVEVQIPWSALPQVRDNQRNLRGRIAFLDGDQEARPAIETVIASGPGALEQPADLLPMAGSTAQVAGDLMASFLRDRGIQGQTPLLDRSANFAGDAAPERVAVYPRYVVALGPGIAGGNRYAFFEFPYTNREDVVETAVRDVTGDGREDLVLRLRSSEQGITREVLNVYSVPSSGDGFARVFAQELTRTVSANNVSNRYAFEAGGRIRITYADNMGFTAATFPGAREPDVNLPLLPWGPHRAVIYRYDGATNRFTQERTEANPNAGNGAPVQGSSPTTPTPAVQEPPPPEVNAVLNLFRRQFRLAPDARPEFSLRGNVAEDPTPESVMMFGRILVVVGNAFMGGRSFYTMEMPEGSEVAELALGDVTGDGRAEAWVRLRRNSNGTIGGLPVVINRELLFVYGLDASRRGRLFGVEVARRVAENSIVNEVARPAAGARSELVIHPGRAQGWSQANYPFRDPANPGIAPLLLPWESTDRVIYRWNGSTLAR